MRENQIQPAQSTNTSTEKPVNRSFSDIFILLTIALVAQYIMSRISEQVFIFNGLYLTNYPSMLSSLAYEMGVFSSYPAWRYLSPRIGFTGSFWLQPSGGD